MKRIIQLTLIAALLVPTAALAGRSGGHDRDDVRYKGETRGPQGPREAVGRPAPPRGPVVVRPDFPIRRERPVVVVRRHPAPIERRLVYVPAPVIWRGVIVTPPRYAHWAWEDSEVLSKWDGWSDVVLDVNGRGRGLYLELGGPVQLDFAEIVFSNGRTQVVDFQQRVNRRGVYDLMDFRNGARVDYVRLVARAMAPSVRVSVRLGA